MGSGCGKPAATLRGEPDADGVDRNGIVRNLKGEEEPHSDNPELWNIDGTEMDMNAKYKVGGQMWYLQDRAKGNQAKMKPIAGFPINDKACKAGRTFSSD